MKRKSKDAKLGKQLKKQLRISRRKGESKCICPGEASGRKSGECPNVDVLYIHAMHLTHPHDTSLSDPGMDRELRQCRRMQMDAHMVLINLAHGD